MAESWSERLARALGGRPEARSVSEDEVMFGGNPIDELRRTVNTSRPTPEQVDEGWDALGEEAAYMAPVAGETLSARDAWDASGRGAQALGEGRYGDAVGDYVDMLTGTVGAIPVVGTLARASKRAGQWMDRNLPAAVNAMTDLMPQASQDTLYAIPAWHGSPHDFDRFDMSKLGTGEGAQAYGHGLYFAENPAVAKSYRDTLGDADISVPYKDFLDTIRAASPDINVKTANQIASRIRQHMTLSGSLAEMRAGIASMPLSDSTRNAYNAALDLAEKSTVTPRGKLYHTELDVEPEDLLDWDRSISEQSDKVREAIGRLPEGKALFEQEALVRQLQGRLDELKTQRMTPEINAEAGSLSRQLLQERQRLQHLEARFEDYKTLTGSPAASQALREAGIPGIRFLDQGSRGAGQGSSNYVIFDDSLVKILGKE